MNIIITGSTGMVGSEVVRQAIGDPGIDQINLVIRRRSHISHPKVKEYIHEDFMNYDALKDVFEHADACLWCLGISQSRVGKKDYFNITYNYTVAAAKAMLAANPRLIFAFLSGQGADSKERGFTRFSKVKGQAENALIRLQPDNLFIFRPGGIKASIPASGSQPFFKKLEFFAVDMMLMLWPWSVVTTKHLALVMLKVVREGYPKRILTHRDIKRIAATSADASSSG